MTKTYPEIIAEEMKRTIFSEARGSKKNSARFIIYSCESNLYGNAYNTMSPGNTGIEDEEEKIQTINDPKKFQSQLDSIMKKMSEEWKKQYNFYYEPAELKMKPDLEDYEFQEFLLQRYDIDIEEGDIEDLDKSEIEQYWEEYSEDLRKSCAIYGCIIDIETKQSFTFFVGTDRPREWGLQDGFDGIEKHLRLIGIKKFERFDAADDDAFEPSKQFKNIMSKMKKSWIGKIK